MFGGVYFAGSPFSGGTPSAPAPGTASGYSTPSGGSTGTVSASAVSAGGSERSL